MELNCVRVWTPSVIEKDRGATGAIRKPKLAGTGEATVNEKEMWYSPTPPLHESVPVKRVNGLPV